jgi:hypothetical protein
LLNELYDMPKRHNFIEVIELEARWPSLIRFADLDLMLRLKLVIGRAALITIRHLVHLNFFFLFFYWGLHFAIRLVAGSFRSIDIYLFCDT